MFCLRNKKIKISLHTFNLSPVTGQGSQRFCNILCTLSKSTMIPLSEYESMCRLSPNIRLFCSAWHVSFNPYKPSVHFNSLPPRKFICTFFPLQIFSKSTFSKNSYRNTISVQQFGSRSGPTFCWA